MSDVSERRRHQRISVNLPVKIHISRDGQGDKVVRARLLNISEGGMMFQTEQPWVSVGENVLVEIPIGGRGGILEAKVTRQDPTEFEISEDDYSASIVRWTDGGSGSFGVEFTRIGPQTKKLLEEIHRFVDEMSDEEVTNPGIPIK